MISVRYGFVTEPLFEEQTSNPIVMYMAKTGLVVDDEPAILRLIVALLQEFGYETLAASDAETALALISKHHPDLMITDVRLPGMSGPDLIEQVRTMIDPPKRIVIISAYGEPKHHPDDVFIAKPFDIDELVEAIGTGRRR